MAHYRINGGKKLNGKISISGSKNAAVAIIPAVILCGKKCTLKNIPDIDDVRKLILLLESIGAKVEFDTQQNIMTVDPSGISSTELTGDLMRELRASYYFLGALLGKYGKAKLALPGGCSIGKRPIDIHISGMEALGVEVKLDKVKNTITAFSKNNNGELFCSSGSIKLQKRSVGGTINIMMAAAAAKYNETVIRNAAKEPHVVDVANFLNAMGANITGAGTDTITIRPTNEWHGCTYEIIPDQIETGTYMIAAAAAGGCVTLCNVIPKHMEALTQVLLKCGVGITKFSDDERDYITIDSKGKGLSAAEVVTEPYPGFPTDLQQPLVALLAAANGQSIVREEIFEARFAYVEQLNLMGASIKVLEDNRLAVINGVGTLKAQNVIVPDLRAGAALIVAALMAEGESNIYDIQYLDRGYEKLDSKLKGVGADITRIED